LGSGSVQGGHGGGGFPRLRPRRHRLINRPVRPSSHSSSRCRVALRRRLAAPQHSSSRCAGSGAASREPTGSPFPVAPELGSGESSGAARRAHSVAESLGPRCAVASPSSPAARASRAGPHFRPPAVPRVTENQRPNAAAVLIRCPRRRPYPARIFTLCCVPHAILCVARASSFSHFPTAAHCPVRCLPISSPTRLHPPSRQPPRHLHSPSTEDKKSRGRQI